MQITDPIADLLTRIRNASLSKHETVDVPASNMKKAIVEILNDEGYIKDFQVIENGKQGVIRITGLRFYASVDELPRVLKGLGIAIVSTSKGIMTDKEARKQHIGGEVLAYIW